VIFHRGADPADPEPVGRRSGLHEHRRVTRSGRLATGTLACPRCDAPVVLGAAVAAADLMGCPYCLHTGAVREFLSLAAPSRPARVAVRVVGRARVPLR
jgi:hypothetical protein